jgi:NADH dehydrogenase FAD-containing subunit
MMVLANLERFTAAGCRATVVQPSPFHYYSGMGPGMLGGTYSPEEIRFATRHVVEKKGGRFIEDRVVRIDHRQRKVYLEKGDPLPYDALSCNVGSYVPAGLITESGPNVFTVKPIEKLLAARRSILDLSAARKARVAVVGGGASAVEIAGNVRALTGGSGLHPAEITVFARTKVMADLPPKVRALALGSLHKRDIAIAEHTPVAAVHARGVELEEGRRHDADIIFVAVGVRPSPLFRESGLTVGPDGGLMVNRYLQSVDAPCIFGGGDCIFFREDPLDKVGVYAVRQNPVLLHNLKASLGGGTLREFEPGSSDYLLIFNLGEGAGIFRKRYITFNGRPAFWIKDYIDRKFMKKFQAVE